MYARYELRRTVQLIELSIAQLIDRNLWIVQNYCATYCDLFFSALKCLCPIESDLNYNVPDSPVTTVRRKSVGPAATKHDAPILWELKWYRGFGEMAQKVTHLSKKTRDRDFEPF